MRKNPLFLCALSFLTVLSACKSDGVEYIDESYIEEFGDLTEIAYDFKIHPLKSDAPLEGIGGIKSWGNVMLARTNNSRKILRFDNYQLTSVLDRLGGGPGEYYFIEDFSYDEVNNSIYIENDTNLVTYDATTLEFKGKQGVNIQIQNILNVGDKMLYFGYYTDEVRNAYLQDTIVVPRESMILVDRDERDLRKGKVLFRESLLTRSTFGWPELFYVNPKNYSTCLPGLINTIVSFNDGEMKELYRFKLGSEPVPEYYEELLNVDTVSLENYRNITERMSALRGLGPYIRQTYNIMVDEGTISFRVDYNWPYLILNSPSRYLYFVRKNNKTKVYQHLRIPGLSMDVDPTGANGNHQIAIIENLGDLAIDDSQPMSPLAEQILEELKKQNDDNPVLLEFRFK